MAQIDRSEGLVGNTGIKAPVRAATTANITLSGEQTIDGIACVTGDRVLVKDQTSGTENGIYVVSTGSWERSDDFDGPHDVANGTMVLVNSGSVSAYSIYAVIATDPVVVGASTIVFDEQFTDARVSLLTFGAVGDGVTDDSSAIQTAINWLSNNSTKRLHAPAGTYLCSSNIYAHYDVTNNPNFNSGALTGSGISVVGDGAMTRQNYKNATYNGTVFKFANNKGLITSNGGTQKTTKQHWEKLSVIGNTTGILWDAVYSPLWSLFDSLFIGNANTSATGTAFKCGDNWSTQFSNIELVGRSDLTAGTAGDGFVYAPTSSGGGNNIFMNITAAYFGDYGISFGNDYDVTYAAYLSYWSVNNTIINCQGQYCATGVAFKHRFGDSTIENVWSEFNTVADITIDNSSQGLSFKKGTLRSNTVTTEALVILGNDSGTAAIDACRDIDFDGTFFFCNVSTTNYIPGVRKHKSALDIKFTRCKVYNGGAAFVSVDVDDVGGEVIFEDNDYYPTSASSEMVVARRYCYMPTSSTFSDRSYNLRRSDYAVGEYSAASFDMSTWRYAAEKVVLDTLSNSISVLLPLNLDTAIGRSVETQILKRYTSNTVTIDAGTNYYIDTNTNTTGAQTLTITLPLTFAKVRHNGTGSFRWRLFETNDLSTIVNTSVQQNISVPNTDPTNQYGVLKKDTTRWLHNFNYGNNGSVTTQGNSLFLGKSSGNFTSGTTAANAYEASNNTGIGDSTLAALTIGYQNTASGVSAGAALTTGYQNTFTGFQSGVSSNTGYGNSGCGSYSLAGVTTGYNNTGVGYQAGRYLSDGTTANAAPNTCVYLGHNSKGSTATRSNEIVIGASAIGNGSNTITLGNTSVTQVYTSGAENILVGTAIPAGGTAGSGYKFSSTANYGVFFGSGAPSLTAAKGSLYLRSDGSTTNDRMYVNTDGGTTWTAVVTVG